jgi:hypothetical protein
MRHHLALVVCLAFTGSIAHAAPARPGKVTKKSKAKPKAKAKVAPPVEDRDDDDDDDTADADADEAPRLTKPKRSKHKRARTVQAREEVEDDSDHESERIATRVEPTADDDLAEPVDAPVRVTRTATKARPKQWHVAFGPYLWASAVDANVSVGPASVSAGVDFMDIQRNARYGVPVIAEARYGRFAIYGDLLYGVVGLNGAKEVGPVMVTVGGNVSSLMVDGAAGYTLAGGEQSLLSVEARTGVRYQRTSISGTVDVSGADVSPPTHVDAAADLIAGAHVVLRPSKRFAFSGTIDLGVAGSSTNTWSATTDASVRLGSHVLLSLGWKTLTTERPNVSITMHGPRAAVQLLF